MGLHSSFEHALIDESTFPSTSGRPGLPPAPAPGSLRHARFRPGAAPPVAAARPVLGGDAGPVRRPPALPPGAAARGGRAAGGRGGSGPLLPGGRPEARGGRPLLRRDRQTPPDVLRRHGDRPRPVQPDPPPVGRLRAADLRPPAGGRGGGRVRGRLPVGRGPAHRVAPGLTHPDRVPDRREARPAPQRGGDGDRRGHRVHRRGRPAGPGRLHPHPLVRVRPGHVRRPGPPARSPSRSSSSPSTSRPSCSGWGG